MKRVVHTHYEGLSDTSSDDEDPIQRELTSGWDSLS